MVWMRAWRISSFKWPCNETVFHLKKYRENEHTSARDVVTHGDAKNIAQEAICAPKNKISHQGKTKFPIKTTAYMYSQFRPLVQLQLPVRDQRDNGWVIPQGLDVLLGSI